MQQKEYKKIPLIKPIAELVAIVILLLGITYAWFYQGNIATVGPLNLDVVSAYDVSVSQSGKDEFGVKIDITNQSPNPVYLSEYSGTGRHLYKPIYNNRKIWGLAEQASDAHKEYIEFKIDVKADANVGLYLSSSSYVKPLCVGTAEMTPDEFGACVVPEQLSDYTDYIAGAVRVAIFDESQTGEKTTVVWAPNAKYEYQLGSAGVDNAYHTTANGTVEPVYQFACGRFSNTLYGNQTISDVLTGIQTDGTAYGFKNIDVTHTDGGDVKDTEKVCYIWGDIDNTQKTPPVVTLSPHNGPNDIKTLTVRVWIEGCDREAIKELISGQFKIHLDFHAEPSEVSN